MTQEVSSEAAVKKADEKIDQSRRDLFKKSAIAAVGLAVAGVALGAKPAAAKMTQAGAMYQPKPHGSQKCSACARFTPGPKPTADGSCAVVAGQISPDGWCVMFTPK